MIETYAQDVYIQGFPNDRDLYAQGVYIQGFPNDRDLHAQGVYIQGFPNDRDLCTRRLYRVEILNNSQAYHNVLSPISPSFWGGVVNYLILLRRVMTAFKQPLGLKISGIILGSIMEALQHCILIISREFSTSRGSHQ